MRLDSGAQLTDALGPINYRSAVTFSPHRHDVRGVPFDDDRLSGQFGWRRQAIGLAIAVRVQRPHINANLAFVKVVGDFRLEIITRA